MSNATWLAERDRIVSEFIEACPRPTVAEVLDWKRRHPDFSDEIVSTAAVMIEYPGLDEDAEVAEVPLHNDATFQNFLSRMRSEMPPAAPTATLADVVAEAGTDLPALARKIGIGRVVLADVEAGRVHPFVGQRLLEALSTALGKSKQVIDDAIMASFLAPSMGHAMSDEAPQSVARSFEEAIRDSGMPHDRQRFWLGED